MEPYIPQELPLNLAALDWQTIACDLSQASAALAYYNGVLGSIVNPAIFLSPLETKEAVLSSRIEGTITTVDDVLRFEVDLKPKTQTEENDIVEVLNYRKATRFANDWLRRGLPFNQTLICAIHNELMQGVRGNNKHPGEIRRELVWIGPKGCKMENATYVPPEPLSLAGYLKNLVDYMNQTDHEALIQTAIMHAQFEIIHPFCDGNGRTGRILIPLLLWQRSRISAPMFYVSEFFDENRDQYVQNLGNITKEGKWGEWLQFFLRAIVVQAQRSSEKANQVLDLYNSLRERIGEITKSPQAIRVLDALFVTPFLKSAEFIKISGLEEKSAHRILKKLKDEGILITVQKHAGRSPEILLFEDLFRLIR